MWNYGKILRGENIPDEYRFMMQEPRTYKTYLDFVILFRWTWVLQVVVCCLLFAFFPWIVSLIAFVVMQAISYACFKLYFKKVEDELNKSKSKFRDLTDRITGY